MRKEPAHRSEMVSQLLFGEFAEVHEEHEQFLRITSVHDGYEGWVQATQLTYTDKIQETNEYISSWSAEVKVDDRKVHAAFTTPVFKDVLIAGKKLAYENAATWNVAGKSINEEAVTKIASVFLETPYLWGGRSVFGIDCSGFVQQVFKFFGLRLLRDAYLQAEQGTAISFDDHQPCDIAFFENENGRITHVGILLSGNRIIHAAGKVRIDTMTKDGIWNAELNKQTHRLTSIRRF